MSFAIGPFVIQGWAVLAPMAGITDRPFRQICRRHGAGMASSEMVTTGASLFSRCEKTRLRLDISADPRPRVVQIAGSCPQQMAEAARRHQDNGVDIIDINMGCPAKIVCRQQAGSALLRDEILVARILESVIATVTIPVTVKIRTGWNAQQRNGLQIAALAEQCGVQALAVHGRTRADAFRGQAEYDTLAAICAKVRIPVLANGDINSAEKAAEVLRYSKASAVMIGRAAYGNPWIFDAINHYMAHGTNGAGPSDQQQRQQVDSHLLAIHDFYGPQRGVRIARRHIAWYSRGRRDNAAFRATINRVTEGEEQRLLVQQFLQQQEQPKAA